MGDNIIAGQKSLEEEMIAMGKLRYQREVQQAIQGQHESTTPYGLQLLGSGALRVTNRIAELIKEFEKGKPLPYYKPPLEMLRRLPIDVTAFIALKVCVNHLSQPVAVQKVAMDIGSQLDDEYQLRHFRKLNKPLMDVVQRDLLTKTTNYRRQKNILMRSAAKAGMKPDDKMLPSIKVKVGIILIDVICSETGIFECKRITIAKNRTPILFCATNKSLRWIKNKNSICELLSPVKMPTLIPPKRWTRIDDGGYFNYVGQLVKSKDASYLAELNIRFKRGEMKQVLDAVNSLQETQWQVNKKILKVMQYYDDKNISIPCLPEPEDLKQKDYPENAQNEEIIDWKRAATKVYAENLRRKTKRIQHGQLLWMANKFCGYKKIFFPYSLDFRGRAYASSTFLNPQAQDTGRSLLLFAKGKPLGDSGEAWLAVHGANCWGYDKVSLEDRVEWVAEHEEMIVDCAYAPYINTEWMEADKPWQFLAFCYEWMWMDQYDDEYRNCHISYLPIGIDGSCNGLQHFSAMLKDEVGGVAVNLTPTDTPQDIYQIVADKVKKDTPDLDWVDRTLVKRPVMTTPYGATKWGMRKQVEEELKKQIEKGHKFPFPHDDLWKPASALADSVWTAIGEIVVASRQAMLWLQGIAMQVSSLGVESMYWYVPSGFLIKQAYVRPVKKRVKTVLNGKFAFLYIIFPSKNLDKQKQINSIAPNYIHSLDSSHMMGTVNACVTKDNMDSFHIVHDSFGVHACDVEQLTQRVKEEFIKMYAETNLLEDFRAEIGRSLPDGTELTKVPNQGKLDLKKLIDADFFFS